jgi:putative spermidine/putrescine transport system permease protein
MKIGRKTIPAAGQGAILVVLPASFVLVFFILPILALLSRSVYDPTLISAFPRTAQAIGNWNERNVLPNTATVAAFIADIRAADPEDIGRAGRRLNSEIPGYRSLLLKTQERISGLPGPAGAKELFAVDRRWQDLAYWAALANDASALTPSYLLAAVDLTRGVDGSVQQVNKDQRVFRIIILRTLTVSFTTTVLCILFAFPLAYLLAASGPRMRLTLATFVMLPFWTSLLVRSVAWLVLLQDEGPITTLLRSLGGDFSRVQLIHNRFGVYVAMVHTLLPFAVLPLFSVMVNIPKSLVRAAFSLGGGPIRTFFRVYLPQTSYGLAGAAALVFVSAVGYYITPALVGGAQDQMLSYYIAEFVNATVNWGMAAALSLVLVVIIGVIAALFWQAILRTANASG